MASPERPGLAAVAALLAGACAAPVQPPLPASSPRPPLTVPTPPARASDRIPSGPFLFYEDFERGHGRWELGQASGGWGFHPLNAATCGGMWTVLLGRSDHAEFLPASGEAVLALREALSLVGARRPFLKFDVRGVVTPQEALALQAEVRPRGGAWTPVGRQVDGRHVFMASIGADLAAWAGASLELRFRASFGTPTARTPGVYLDDIHVIEAQD